MIVIESGDVRGDIDFEIARLESLVADLKRLRAAELPTAAELESAPILDEWQHATRTEPCLAGQVHDHPRLGTRLAMTSGLWAWSPTLGWARTLSRYYRLGRTRGQGPQA